MIVVDDEFVFRLARSQRYAERVAVDVRLLRSLAPLLPLPIPRPRFVSLDPPFFGYRKIRGRSVQEDQLVLSEAESLRLGEFLDVLHRVPIKDAAATGIQLETPSSWRQDWARAWDRYRRALPLLPADVQHEAERRWDGFLSDDANFEFQPKLIHADLTPRHVLWEDDRLTGFIDWSDAQVGDVAMDFAWPLCLPDVVAKRVLSVYSAHDVTGLRERARFYEWTGWWSDAIHGLETGDRSFVERGLAGVMRQLR